MNAIIFASFQLHPQSLPLPGKKILCHTPSYPRPTSSRSGQLGRVLPSNRALELGFREETTSLLVGVHMNINKVQSWFWCVQVQWALHNPEAPSSGHLLLDWKQLLLGTALTGDSSYRGQLLLGTALTGDSSYWGQLLLGTALTGDSSYWGQLLLGTALTGDSSYWGQLLLGTALTGDSSYWGQLLLGRALTGESSYWGELLLGTALTGDSSYWGQLLLGTALTGDSSYWRQLLLGTALIGDSSSWGDRSSYWVTIKCSSHDYWALGMGTGHTTEQCSI